jgi:hypothetical protein
MEIQIYTFNQQGDEPMPLVVRNVKTVNGWIFVLMPDLSLATMCALRDDMESEIEKLKRNIYPNAALPETMQ